MSKKRLAWRCRNAQQQKDKATIYNSREWRELRMAKMRANPLCEECAKHGIVRSAHCVHHIVPIETATTMEEMRRLAFCGLGGLMSLCDECHARIHKEAKSHSKQAVQERAEQRHERWKANMLGKFTAKADAENPAAPV